MDIKNILSIINSNPNGVTIDIATSKKTNHLNGYYVAMTDNQFTGANEMIIKNLAYKLNQIEKHDIFKKLYLGSWIDEKTGKLYIDITLFTEFENIAVALGNVWGQKAIYDIGNQKSIDIR